MTNDSPTFLQQTKNLLLVASVSGILGGCGALVTMYFNDQSQNTRISALEENTVRKDVLSETLTPMKSDINEMKGDIKTLLKGLQ